MSQQNDNNQSYDRVHTRVKNLHFFIIAAILFAGLISLTAEIFDGVALLTRLTDLAGVGVGLFIAWYFFLSLIHI